MDMPAGMADLLARKYAILQQQADAGTTTANANANAANAAAKLDTERANVVAPESRANIGLTVANTGLARANTGLVGAQADQTRKNTSWIDRLNESQITLQGAQTGLYGAQAGLAGAQARVADDGIAPIGSTLPSLKRIVGQRVPSILDY